MTAAEKIADKAAAYEAARAECYVWADAAAAVDSIPRYPGEASAFKTAYNAKIGKVGAHLSRMADLAEHRAEEARIAACVKPVICAICSTDYDKSTRSVCPHCYCDLSLQQRKEN